MRFKGVRQFFTIVMLASITSVVLAQEAGGIEILKAPGYVFGVTVTSVEELDVILDRADSLRELFDPEQYSRVVIVLHGEELQLFQKDNYAANRSIVERARLLDQENIIDIKACQTMMRFLEIDQSEMPEFIEQVPFAPTELKRLVEEYGFTRL